ncbi:transcription initiation factor TFIID subunit 4 isoform X1 [Polypterus senegalus]|uniref:transcription initiation factor TFIID subunit 4 isoform X1 n=1 Tax=Polypterus senegalus TaxID=55291 RepID=UPI001964C161|nr:transcription initiation factor TFIID subunit 4 isoform X1 [Polypterus senegalus]
MAAGSDLLDEVIFNTEVDERVVSDLVGSLESQLSGSSLGNSEIAAQAVGNHIGSSGAGGNTNVQEPKMGHAVDLAKAGSGVQGGVINNTRSPGAVVNATVGIITSATGSETAMVLSSSKPVTVNAMATPPVANHTAGNGKIGPVGVQTLNGSNVVVNSHGAGSAVTLVPSSSSSVSSSGSSSAPAVTVLNNGPATVGKASVSSNTVIQTSFVGAQHVTSPAISSQTSVTLVRPPVHTTNGSPVLSVGSGIPMQTTLPAGAAGTIKSESPKTIIQNAPPGVSLALQTVTPQQQQTVAVPKGGPVVHNLPRTNTPTAAAAPAAVNPGAIRTIAPQVLAPRLPPAPQNPPNIQNIQLPPGMVLVRSESGQLLMIHQQTLAQMQAQSQPQNTMTPRPATPSSSSSVQLSSVQAPGAPLIARQVTPTTIIKQPTQAQTTVQATSALQRSSVVQPQIVLSGATATGTIATPSAVQPITPQRTVPGAPVPPTNTATETLENVKKCKNFLSTLIKLASSGKQSSETAANVKDLVQNLLEGKIEAEDFTSRLYQELHSSPQPYLVPFLKRSLPALRQLTPDSAAFIQQSQVQQPIAQATTALTSVTLGSPIQRSAGKAIATVTSTLQQPVISLSQTGHNKPGQTAPLVMHQSQQQGALLRPPQVTLAQTPMVTLRPPQNRIVLSTPQVHLKQLSTVPVLKQTVLPGGKASPVSSVQAAASQKNKLKDTGGGSFRDDDDINDVASMAGVNLSEESARILATNSDLVGTLMRSCKDEAFFFTPSLHRRIAEIGKKFGFSEVSPEIVNYVSHATQQRLQSLIEKVSEVAQLRNVSYKDDERSEQVSDVRSQLKFFEQLDHLEKQRKEEQEREILLKAAKSRSRQEDPEQLRLKQKAKEMQQQELAQMRQRDANLTALAAIGPRKKRKVDLPGPGAITEGSGSSGSLSGSSAVNTTRQFTRQRITRVNLRDLLFCLENEPQMRHSHLLYRAFLK